MAVFNIITCVWAILMTSVIAENEIYPTGDLRSCLQGNSGHRYRFEVLPGGGWDNLRNKETGMIMKLKFSQCRTTEDGRFLLPDGVFTVPLKRSNIETNAEIFEHWKTYSSTLSHSININAGLNMPNYEISGSFSAEYQQVKSSQHLDKTVTTRTQARYLQYASKLEPDMPVSDTFRKRLHKIAASILLNRTDLACYDSQLLIRDYGTHVITSLDVGAALVQVDQLQEDYLRKYAGQNTNINASIKVIITKAATTAFAKTFNFDTQYSTSSSKEQVDDYMHSRTSSQILTYGGPAFRPTNFSANQWLDNVDNELVALDKSGDPIYYLVNDVNLPDVPPSVVYQASQIVKDAVEVYYKHNTIPGCTKKDSPNFSFQANADDGSCQAAKANFTFGGVYQTCTSTGQQDHCSTLREKNPQTGNYSCPSGYAAILLQTGSAESSETRQECESCYLFWHCCTTRSYPIKADYQSYWCAATDNMAPNSGFLFGGLYTTTTANINTQSRSCPTKFYPMKLLTDLVICISDDYELGNQNSLPFAGFFSCKSGNPLALKERTGLLERSSMLTEFLLLSGPASYPATCPESYSQHLALIDDGCSIQYCIKTGAIRVNGLPPIKQPPFMEAPQEEFSEDRDRSVVVNDDGEGWISEDEANAMHNLANVTTKSDPTSKGGASVSTGSSGGYIALIAVLASLIKRHG